MERLHLQVLELQIELEIGSFSTGTDAALDA